MLSPSHLPLLPLLASLAGACREERAVVRAAAPTSAAPRVFELALDPTRSLRSYSWDGASEIPWLGKSAPERLPFGELGRTPRTRLYLGFNQGLDTEVASQPGGSGVVARGSAPGPGRFAAGCGTMAAAMADSDSRAGHRYATTAILDYTNRVHTPHDAGLARAFATPDDVPSIMVSPSDGRLLAVLLRLVAAKKVVEVGTLIGYSALQMLRALPADGHLWTIEFEPRHAELARQNLASAGMGPDRVTVLQGAGVDVLPTLVQHGPFDAVFIDADKVNYDHYGAWALANLRRGGLVLGDNAYLFGELMDDSDRGRAMRAFHDRVAAACDSVCVATPDGLVIGIKR
jgi:caffeoyl-CoA O-methyltransferase